MKSNLNKIPWPAPHRSTEDGPSRAPKIAYKLSPKKEPSKGVLEVARNPLRAAFCLGPRARPAFVPRALLCPESRRLFEDPIFCFLTQKTYERAFVPSQCDPGSLVPNHLARKLARVIGEREKDRGPAETSLVSLLTCPIRLEIFQDPVIARDGHSYDATSWEHLIQAPMRSPMTRALLPNGDSYANDTIRSLMLELGLPLRSPGRLPNVSRASGNPRTGLGNLINVPLAVLTATQVPQLYLGNDSPRDAARDAAEQNRLAPEILRAQEAFRRLLRPRRGLNLLASAPSQARLRDALDALTLILDSTSSARLRSRLYIARATCFALQGTWEVAAADLHMAEISSGFANVVAARRRLLFPDGAGAPPSLSPTSLLQRLRVTSTTL